MKLKFFSILFQSLIGLILREFDKYVLVFTLGTFKAG